MHISFEIVPRSEEAVREQITFIETELPFIDAINVPDLLRLPIRSWDAGQYINQDRYAFIPHFRSIDFDLKESRLEDIIEAKGLDRVLLVSGDPPPDMSHRVFETDVVDLIGKIRKRFPDIEIYAGFDPYRWSVKQEKAYIHRKLDAGADFLLSQPFFDHRFLEIFSDFIPSEKVFWGISPVVTDKSKAYWEKMNNAVFPKNYQASYEWNIALAKEIIGHCASEGGNIYFMPIRINLENYFLPIRDAMNEAGASG